jgi:enoyl-CoA hydratase/carnithine racemase
MSAEAAGPAVRLSVADGVAEICFCRPPVNPMSTAMLADLNAAIDAVPGSARAILLTSSVEGMFIAGADIAFMCDAPVAEQGEYVRTIQRTFSRLEASPLPVVAGIDGACLGGGLEIALTGDVRIVSETSIFGLPEVTLGILAGAGGIQRLVRAVPQAVAHDILLTGRRISGAEAGAWGLASRVTAEGEATDAAREVARRLARGAGEAIAMTKQLAIAAAAADVSRQLDREWEGWMEVRPSANSQEGLTAFMEKRRPGFR